MLFARPGEYKPCGIFSLEHFGLIAVTIVCIAIAIKNTYKSSKEEVKKIINKLTEEMLQHAEKMEFEEAAKLRDQIKELESSL